MNKHCAGSRNNITNNYETLKIPRSSLKLYSKPNTTSIANVSNPSIITNNIKNPVKKSILRPVIKNMSSNYGNKTIKLDNKFISRLNDGKLLNYSDLDISDSMKINNKVDNYNNLNQSEFVSKNEFSINNMKSRKNMIHFKS